MSSYSQFRSNGIIENGKVISSEITKSSIDMNNAVITSHAQPVNDTDVANKIYIDSRIRTITINITGLSVSPITLPGSINILRGSLIINVVCISSINGPSATFQLNKSNQTFEGSIHRTNTSAGTGTLERLRIEWLPNSTPTIYKTGNGYNGIYQLFIMPNYILL